MKHTAPHTAPAERSPSLPLRLWTGTAARFTVIAVCVLTVNLLLSGTDSNTYVEPLHFLMFLPFAFALTLATLIRRSDKLSAAARWTLHPLCVLGGFYLCLYMPYQIKNKPTGGQVLAIILLVAVVYGLAMAVIGMVTRRSRRAEIESAPYESQFGGKK